MVGLTLCCWQRLEMPQARSILPRPPPLTRERSDFVVSVEKNTDVDRQRVPSHTHVETRFVSFTPA